eukprot:2546857-Alexandrium_andersonii.AAC.1
MARPPRTIANAQSETCCPLEVQRPDFQRPQARATAAGPPRAPTAVIMRQACSGLQRFAERPMSKFPSVRRCRPDFWDDVILSRSCSNL